MDICDETSVPVSKFAWFVVFLQVVFLELCLNREKVLLRKNLQVVDIIINLAFERMMVCLLRNCLAIDILRIEFIRKWSCEN